MDFSTIDTQIFSAERERRALVSALLEGFCDIDVSLVSVRAESGLYYTTTKVTIVATVTREVTLDELQARKLCVHNL